jgi:hypothetical protein
MEFIFSLHDALPWYLQLNGSGHLAEILGDWGAERGIVRGDDWTLLFLWVYKWLVGGALLWGVGAALLVIKRSPRGRFRGDPEKIRHAVVTGVLRVAAGAVIAAGAVLVLFLAAAVGPGPLIWAAVALLGWRLARAAMRSSRRRKVDGAQAGLRTARPRGQGAGA